MLKNRFSLKNKKIIVLGGNGLIGSAISSLFHANGGDVIIIDKKKSKLQKKIKDIKENKTIKKNIPIFFDPEMKKTKRKIKKNKNRKTKNKIK